MNPGLLVQSAIDCIIKMQCIVHAVTTSLCTPVQIQEIKIYSQVTGEREYSEYICKLCNKEILCLLLKYKSSPEVFDWNIIYFSHPSTHFTIKHKTLWTETSPVVFINGNKSSQLILFDKVWTWSPWKHHSRQTSHAIVQPTAWNISPFLWAN